MIPGLTGTIAGISAQTNANLISSFLYSNYNYIVYGPEANNHTTLLQATSRVTDTTSSQFRQKANFMVDTPVDWSIIPSNIPNHDVVSILQISMGNQNYVTQTNNTVNGVNLVSNTKKLIDTEILRVDASNTHLADTSNVGLYRTMYYGTITGITDTYMYIQSKNTNEGRTFQTVLLPGIWAMVGNSVPNGGGSYIDTISFDPGEIVITFTANRGDSSSAALRLSNLTGGGGQVTDGTESNVVTDKLNNWYGSGTVGIHVNTGATTKTMSVNTTQQPGYGFLAVKFRLVQSASELSSEITI